MALGRSRRRRSRHRLVGQRVDARVLARCSACRGAVSLALPQLAHDLDGLLEHLQPYVGLRPRVAEDVLVERLAGADAEHEPAVQLNSALVAAACAMTAGWMRTVGHVTAVVTGQRQAWLSAPMIGPDERRSGPARRSRGGSGRRSTATRSPRPAPPCLRHQLGRPLLLGGEEIAKGGHGSLRFG